MCNFYIAVLMMPHAVTFVDEDATLYSLLLKRMSTATARLQGVCIISLMLCCQICTVATKYKFWLFIEFNYACILAIPERSYTHLSPH